ncbi:permease [Sporosalibacterium faouarense]|uniref:permease n=1 Tax=Sporosalibacterium faouarense TaxID=516123 RepID=UPI00192AEF28|nr:permease [Sporosalibacterium faouarense]
MIFLYVITGGSLFISFILNKDKTIKALKVAWKKIKKILPSFIKMLILISVMLYLLPDKTIAKYLGGTNIFRETILASALGSITIMPGFIAFPLSGILLNKGVKYMVISSFSSTLMMVGILTFPIEKEYFGTKLTVVRNVTSYFIALIIALAIGLLYGEVLL